MKYLKIENFKRFKYIDLSILLFILFIQTKIKANITYHKIFHRYDLDTIHRVWNKIQSKPFKTTVFLFLLSCEYSYYLVYQYSIRFLFNSFILFHNTVSVFTFVTQLMNCLCSLYEAGELISHVRWTKWNLIGWNFVQEVRFKEYIKYSFISIWTDSLFFLNKLTLLIIDWFNSILFLL